jgi:hypothetical protein
MDVTGIACGASGASSRMVVASPAASFAEGASLGVASLIGLWALHSFFFFFFLGRLRGGKGIKQKQGREPEEPRREETHSSEAAQHPLFTPLLG